jgi:hypothetical protein
MLLDILLRVCLRINESSSYGQLVGSKNCVNFLLLTVNVSTLMTPDSSHMACGERSVQDGPAAGQTVPHVHIHCLPRYFEDIPNNDEIYDLIDDAEKAEGSARLQKCAA